MCRLSADRLKKGSGPYEEMNLVFLSLCMLSVHAKHLQWPGRWDAERLQGPGRRDAEHLQWSRRQRQQALYMQLLDFAYEQTTSLCISGTDIFSFKQSGSAVSSI